MFDISRAKHISRCYLIEFLPSCHPYRVPYSRVFFDNEDDVANFIETNLYNVEFVKVYKLLQVEGVMDYVRDSLAST